MRAFISARLVNSERAQPQAKPFEIRDEDLKGFILRVQPTGVRTYYAEYGRGQRKPIARVGVLTPDEARERCKKILGNVALGRHPLEGLLGADGLTLGKFVDDEYEPWLKANRPKGAARSLERLRGRFDKWLTRPLSAISVSDIESWKLTRFAEGRAPGTVLRDVMALSGALTRAVRTGKLTANPVRNVDKPRIDRTPKVRFLSAGEEKRLREALRARDVEMQRARQSANQWRAARKRGALPALEHYGDHLTPAVLLSINTGLRRGELLALRWTDIDFEQKVLTVSATIAKTSQTRHVPLNAEALQVLERWKKQHTGELVIGVQTGFKTAWAALLTRAGIDRFRWHDLRHHFASRLVQKGVPLNTVRELLGHGSLAMTLRYAHLAPDQKREAVARLVAP